MLSADPALAATFAVELATLGVPGQQLHRRGLERYAELAPTVKATIKAILSSPER
jgi:hypothetical protein